MEKRNPDIQKTHHTPSQLSTKAVRKPRSIDSLIPHPADLQKPSAPKLCSGNTRLVVDHPVATILLTR